MPKKKREETEISEEEIKAEWDALNEFDDLDEEKRHKEERSRNEWVVFTCADSRLLFYVQKQGKSLYYNEHGEPIAWSSELGQMTKESLIAAAKATRFADKLNKDPDLAQALLEYAWERDILKNDKAMTVAKRMKLAAKDKAPK
jgi:hypothetical protein